MLKIGDFSKVSRTTIKTLRYYDDIGLLKPSFVDPETNYRFYTTDDLMKLDEIRYLKQAGLNLDEIKLVLSGSNLESVLRNRELELLNEIESIQKKLLHIKDILIKEKQNMEIKITVKELPKQVFFVRRGQIETYASINEFIGGAIKEVMKNNRGLKIDNGYNFTVYEENEFKPKDIKLAYYTAVKEKGVDSENVQFIELDGVKAICALHKGKYDEIGKVYSEVYKYIYNNGYTTCDYPRESYIKGPWNEKNETEFLTEVQVPVS